MIMIMSSAVCEAREQTRNVAHTLDDAGVGVSGGRKKGVFLPINFSSSHFPKQGGHEEECSMTPCRFHLIKLPLRFETRRSLKFFGVIFAAQWRREFPLRNKFLSLL
jgi:hypothetical protein